jgi:arsenate reductase (thioredoxin)
MSLKKVLFLCTGNSARSQMAEGLVNHLLGDQWLARSAGTAPAGYVHPLAIRAMGELGIDISSHRSKSIDELNPAEYDIAITLCDGACEACSVWIGGPRREHIGFPDPAAAQGDEDEQLPVFRQVRDDIRRQVLEYLTRDGQ